MPRAPAAHLRGGASSLQRLTMESFPGGSAVIDMMLLRLRWGCCEEAHAGEIRDMDIYMPVPPRA